jgi:hypothetical protein
MLSFYKGVRAMKKNQILMYKKLYEYLLVLKDPLFVFLSEIVQHLSPGEWWELYIVPILGDKDKQDFRYLDIVDLLKVLQTNWGPIYSRLNNDKSGYVYDSNFALTAQVLQIRHTVAYANEINMSWQIFLKNMAALTEFAKFINAGEEVVDRLESDWIKYKNIAPDYKELRTDTANDQKTRDSIVEDIEKDVLFNAMVSNSLPPDIKGSIVRTMIRLRSMRTSDEVLGFFKGSLKSPRGKEVTEALHECSLIAFADILDKIKEKYPLLY